MHSSFWRKQSKDSPLFPDVIWSKPETSSQAGKLAIIGGNVHGFATAAEAFQVAVTSGAGAARVILPDSLQKTVGKIFEVGEYAPSTPSGSFSQTALAPILDLLAWGNAGLLAGDLGRNSETAIVLEKLLEHHHGQLTITKDALDYFTDNPEPLLKRNDTILVMSLAQLQKMAQSARFPNAFTFSMDLVRFIDTLHAFQKTIKPHIIVLHAHQLVVAAEGLISTTPRESNADTWRVKTAAAASVWWMQHDNKPFEALTCSVLETV